MAKKKILIQIDPDAQPSVFDAVVAIDAGVHRDGVDEFVIITGDLFLRAGKRAADIVVGDFMTCDLDIGGVAVRDGMNARQVHDNFAALDVIPLITDDVKREIEDAIGS